MTESSSPRNVSLRSAGTAALVWAVVLGWWIWQDPTAGLVAFRPGMDGEGQAGAKAAGEEKVVIGELGEAFPVAPPPPDAPGSWPSFRGADASNVSRESTPLARRWPEGGPPTLWSVDLGEGHAGAAVRGGRVYVLDYDEKAKADMLRCFGLEDGKELWRRGYRVRVKRNHGLSRTVPAVSDRFVVTIGPRCHVMCVDAPTGAFRWGLDLEKDYGTATPFWYTGQCPLLDGTTAVIAPAGKTLLMGVDCETGQVLWETPNPKNWKMSHTSVMPMTLAGRRMYVYSAIGGMVGVSAEEADRGKVLWETSLWDHAVLAPSPVIMPDGKIFLTAGYGAGGMLMQVSPDGAGGFAARTLQVFPPQGGMASEQQTPVYCQGHLFGIQPKDAGALQEQFVCYRPDNCQKPVWSSGPGERFGLGPYLVAGDLIFALNDDGTLTMLEASTGGYRRLARARVMDGRDAWAPMAVADGRLILRDLRRMVCLDLRPR